MSDPTMTTRRAWRANIEAVLAAAGVTRWQHNGRAEGLVVADQLVYRSFDERDGYITGWAEYESSTSVDVATEYEARGIGSTLGAHPAALGRDLVIERDPVHTHLWRIRVHYRVSYELERIETEQAQNE